MDKTGWTKVKLGDICKVKSGGTPSSKNLAYYDGDIPFLTINDMTSQGKHVKDTVKHITEDAVNSCSTYKAPAGSLVYSMCASVGFVSFVDVEFTMNQAIAVLNNIDKRVNPDYLYYYLDRLRSTPEFESYIITGTQRNINATILKSFEIPLPPMEIQLQIAKLLTTIDNIIQSKSDELTNYQNMKTQIMNDIFANGEREQNWDKVKIKDIFDTKNGYTPSKSNPEFWNNGTEPWFRLDDIRENGHVLYDSLQKVSKSAIKKTLFPADSIALTTSATVGEHALIRIPSIGNQRFVYFTPKKIYSNSINMLYMNYYFFIIDEWCKIHINMGSSFPTVDMKSLYEMEIPLPPMEIQLMIANLLTMYDDVIETVNKEKEDYEKIKTQMMNMIFA